MDLQRVQHALARHNDLLGLLFNRKRSNQGRSFLSSFPLCKLGQALLSRPDRSVHNLQEQLACAGIKDKNCTIHGLRRQVPFKCLVNGDTVDIRVIHEPNDLRRKQLAVVLRIQVRLSGLGGVQLQTLSNAFTQDVKSRIGFHDLVHGTLKQRFDSREPISKATVQVVGEINSKKNSSRRRIDRHVVSRVVQELGTTIPLDIVGIKIAPSKLNINPVLRCGRAVKTVLLFGE
mmetsp:Transcript_39638/g.86525  ORF Transcript_39638/g.86525 Transcript_39638/m.86525 type:complete len:232 (+) Transcript_39638:1500-2195(+)